ncbi:unnamed protein product, partial [marine sediment metagenome]
DGNPGSVLCKTTVAVSAPTNTTDGYLDVYISPSFKYNDLFSGVFGLVNLQDNNTWVADGATGSAKVDGNELYIQAIGSTTIETVLNIQLISFDGFATTPVTTLFQCSSNVYDGHGYIVIRLIDGDDGSDLPWCTGGDFLSSDNNHYTSVFTITYIATV